MIVTRPGRHARWVLYLLANMTSATAAAATASSAIRRAVSGHPARAACPITVTSLVKGPSGLGF
jgi:hypothetical protein